MRVDHVSYAAEHDGLVPTAERLAKQLGVPYVNGGVHPRFGTKNLIIPLARSRFVEVIEALDHPAADKCAFGQVVRSRSEAGGGWIGFVLRVDDIAPVERRLGVASAEGNRHRPDGFELKWRQVGVRGLQADPQLPFFIQWETDDEHHPSRAGVSDVELCCLQIAGDPDRVRAWCGVGPDYTPSTLTFDFVAPHGTPGLLSCTFTTPTGPVTI